jgi:hypothetical protein
MKALGIRGDQGKNNQALGRRGTAFRSLIQSFLRGNLGKKGHRKKNSHLVIL